MWRKDACKAVALLIALSVVACGKEAPPPADASAAAAQAQATTSSSAAGVPGAAPASAGPAAGAAGATALLQAYLAAWNAHDIAAAAMFFDEQGEYFDAAFAGLQRGRPAIAENAIGVFMRGVPDLHWEVRSAPIVGPEGVAFEWTFTGTNTGTWGGVHATGQKLQLKGMSFLRIRNGKIVYQSTVYDSAALNRQLGL